MSPPPHLTAGTGERTCLVSRTSRTYNYKLTNATIIEQSTTEHTTSIILHEWGHIVGMLLSRSLYRYCISVKLLYLLCGSRYQGQYLSKLKKSIKRSIDITSSGMNGLNIRINASPKWDRTRCPEEWASSVGIQHPFQMFYWNLLELGNTVKISNKVNGGCHCIWPCPRMSCIIWERGASYLIDEIPISTIELLEWRFQMFSDISLPEKFT